MTEMYIASESQRLVLFFQYAEADVDDKYEPRPLAYAVEERILQKEGLPFFDTPCAPDAKKS